MENLRWLGIFSDEQIDCQGDTAADVMVDLLRKKLILPENGSDMVAIVHELETEYNEENSRKEKITSTFVQYGEPGGFTAIAKTVGLPAAIAAKLVLIGELPINGCHIPTHPAIYTKVLKELTDMGFTFKEKVEPIK